MTNQLRRCGMLNLLRGEDRVKGPGCLGIPYEGNILSFVEQQL